MKVLKNLLLCCFVFLSVIFSCVASRVTPTRPPVVAITQIVPHPSLDLIRQGIEDELKEQGIVCDIQFQNAQGNIAMATQIAQKFTSQKPAVIVPITTPSAQTVYAIAGPQGVPVVFGAVNDPVSAKLISSMDQPGKGITGVADLPPVEDQVVLIQEVLPHIKKIGAVYNPGESNSITLLDLFEKELMQKGISLVRAAAANMVDVATATQSLVGKVDALYIPNDNTVVAALESLLKVTQANDMPVFCSDPESVKQGCLGTVTHSQYGLGRQTGKMVAKVLQGVDIQTLLVEKPQNVELSLNQDTADALDIVLPQTVIEQAKYIIKQ